MGMFEIGPHDELKKLYNTPANRRLKHWAIGAISMSIALMLIMILWHDSISYRCMLFMRGCAGLGGLVFVILCGCMVYHVNREYINRK